MRNKIIIITGGAGFIGSAIAQKLIELDYKIIILDNLSTGLLKNIPKNAEFIHFDISKESEYKKLKKLKMQLQYYILLHNHGGGCDIDFEWQISQVEYWLMKHGFTETVTPYGKYIN